MRLHQLIDALDTKTLRKNLAKKFYTDKSRERINRILDSMDSEREVLKFLHPDTPQYDLGTIYQDLSDEEYASFLDYAKALIAEGLFKQQYEKICLSFDYDGQNLMLVTQHEKTKKYEFYIMQSLSDRPYPDGISFEAQVMDDGTFMVTKPSFVIANYEEIPDEFSEWLKYALGTYLCLVAVLNAEGVVIERKAAPKFINRQRAKKGKTPIGDIHEIKIVVDGKKYHYSGHDDENREKGSPKCMHWRRGHIRRYPDGKITNVRPCLVGKIGTPPKNKPTYKAVKEVA